MSAVNQSHCADCGQATTPCTGKRGCRHKGKHEYYAVHEEVWTEEAGMDSGFLCIACLERRIGRRLDVADFKDVPVNDPADPWHTERLASRLAPTPVALLEEAVAS